MFSLNSKSFLQIRTICRVCSFFDDNITSSKVRSILVPIDLLFNTILLIITFLCLFAPLQDIYSQSDNELGLPLIKSFPKEEYQANGQNWSIVQDNKGVMYFGNTMGVLEYDGLSWRLLPFSSIVRSVDVDDKGCIFVGAQGDFGYLRPDSIGSNQFISLIGLLPHDDRQFTNVWKTYATKDGVFFNALSHLFRYKNDSINTWYPGEGQFGWSFLVRDTLFIQKRGVGIFKMVKDSLELIKGTEEIAQVTIFFILPFDDSKLLIGTRARGLEIFENGKITRFVTEIDSFIEENGIYAAQVLSDGSIAIGTRGGLVIISDKGEFIKLISGKEGFIDKSVLTLYSDHQDQLWVGLQDGITRLDWPSPVTNYSNESGLDRLVEIVIRHNDTLYVGGRSGLFYLIPSQVKNGQIINSHFELLEDIKGLLCNGLISFDKRLIIGTNNGIYEYYHGVTTHLGYERTHIRCFYRSKTNPDRLYAGGPEVLVSFILSNDHWVDEGKVNGITGEINPMLETSDGILWLGTRYGGPIRVDFSNGFSINPVVQQFDPSFGIPDGDNYPFSIRDEIVFGTDSGLYRFDDSMEQFLPDSTLGEFFAGKPNGHEVFRIAVENSGNIWISTAPHFGINILQEDGSYEWQTDPYMKMNPYEYSIFADRDSITWFGGDGGIYRYDRTRQRNSYADYYSLIRKVFVNNDSLIFNGNSSFDSISDHSNGSIPTFDSKHNGLRFEFTATDYVDESSVQYQYILDGYDKKWSSWSFDHRKEYTRLPGGEYIFRVRAKNIYNNISKEGIYAFNVLPPWWNTWLARAGYLIIVLLLIRGIVLWRTSKLKQRQKELEMEIAIATNEIVKQKEEVEAQRDEIEAQRDQLKIQRDTVIDQRNEILDSINYAQRIQAAMLPPETYINELLEEVFILYKPRDIVSGDFYWIKLINQFIIIVAADCTGHGVPGAFMSMLGISWLNEIAQRRDITQANQVLNELRSQIKHSLRQHGKPGEQRDGIDMALCVINETNRTMQYSGAYNPLYLIRDKQGQPELSEIKADRMPIGYFHGKAKSFTNNEIKLEIGDTFYIFSDGFIDQKGGKENKKYMSNNFKKLLLRIHDRPMYEQKEVLEKTLVNWMGDNSQIDDILVIGVRV